MSRIDRTSGMGGFLNPPNHPEHTICVRDGNSFMSLSYALTDSYIEQSTKDACKRILDEWDKTKPALETPEMQSWLMSVFRHFKDCYRGEGEEPKCWENFKVVKDTKKNFLDNYNNHCAVHFIQRYYPDFIPSEEFAAKLFPES